jgi:hypothetical protein
MTQLFLTIPFFLHGHLRNAHGVTQQRSVFMVSDDWECDIDAINAMIQDRLNRDSHRHVGPWG